MIARNVARHFLDSNIWIYAFAQNQDKQKQSIATKLVQTTGVVISTQVINEVCTNLLRKSDFSETQISKLITAFYQGSQVITFNAEILRQASTLRGRYAFSFWDSLIVSSACYADVSTLYSEDMQNGLVVNDQLEIVNPFS